MSRGHPFLIFLFWLMFILVGIPVGVAVVSMIIMFTWVPIIKYLLDLLL
ncbi:hypothetical protein LCGC14_1016340 [marine sediment metagenome]|uniref:Uncharacterized protein n=1 Tax=marine sediment metagenome TaxID=412755 RepID=A0A0F9QGZ5_9ZZZZ